MKVRLSLLVVVTLSLTVSLVLTNPVPDEDDDYDDYYDYYDNYDDLGLGEEPEAEAEAQPEAEPEAEPEPEVEPEPEPEPPEAEALPEILPAVPEVLPATVKSEPNEHAHHGHHHSMMHGNHEEVNPIKAVITPTVSDLKVPRSDADNEDMQLTANEPITAPEVLPALIPGRIRNLELADEAVEEPKVAPEVLPIFIPGVVRNLELADETVEEPKVAPEVLPALIPGVVRDPELADETVKEPNVASEVLPSFIPGSIRNPELADETVEEPKVAPEVLPSLIPGVVRNPEFADETAKEPIVAPEVLPTLIPGLVHNPELAGDAVEEPKVAPEVLPASIPVVIPDSPVHTDEDVEGPKIDAKVLPAVILDSDPDSPVDKEGIRKNVDEPKGMAQVLPDDTVEAAPDAHVDEVAVVPILPMETEPEELGKTGNEKLPMETEPEELGNTGSEKLPMETEPEELGKTGSENVSEAKKLPISVVPSGVDSEVLLVSPEPKPEPKSEPATDIHMDIDGIAPVVIGASLPENETGTSSAADVGSSDSPIDLLPIGGEIEIDLQTAISNITKTTIEHGVTTSIIDQTPSPTHLPLPPPPPPPKPVETEQFDDVLNLDKSCTQPPVTGMCRGAFPMFYFDISTRTCKQFVYGGCHGNKNIHKTAADCYRKCYPQGLKSGTLAATTRGSQNDYLTVRGGTGASLLTFTGENAAAKVDPPVLSDFTIADVYAFEFHFRTDSPHGLIAFLRQVSVPEELEGTRIQLYVYLNKGHLAVTHVMGNYTESFVMKKGGLQAGNWHSASVQVNSGTGELTLDVDNNQEYFEIGRLGLQPHYTGGRSQNKFSSVLWIGGVFEGELEMEDIAIGFGPFHGCIQQMSLSSGETSAAMTRVKPFVATKHSGVREHCANNCNDRYRNLCSRKSHCVEHFDHSTCNCFNSGQDGPRCTNPAIPILSLNGDGYVVHRLYEWMDRVHSYTNLISIEFKTRFPDSILFYASAEYPERQYLAASITRDSTIYVEANLGGGAVTAEFGKDVISEIWQKLTILHQHETILIYLGNTLQATLIVPGHVRYFHLDPDFYVGNAPRLSRECGLALDEGSPRSADKECSSGGKYHYYDKNTGTCHPFNYTGCGGNANRFHCKHMCKKKCHVPGLRSMNTFLGCVKDVFFNDISILQSLREENRTTRYYGSTKDVPLGTKCNDKKFLPLTFSTERAVMKLYNPQERNFHLTISFKPTERKGVIASGLVNVTQYESVSEWELRHDKNHVYFYVHDNLLSLKSGAKIKMDNWHYVDIFYKSGRVNMMVNNKKQGKSGPGKLHFAPEVTIGGNILDEFPGFVGCIRKLYIGGTKLDLRTVVGTPMVNKDVTYDNCQVLGPCEGPRACEHGGKCTIDNDGEVQCDCSGTGYSGKKCHFSLYKRSCEQYRQIGYKSMGFYHVDIDGNGPLPPAYVKCSFSSLLQETYTIIEHNMEEKYEVRKSGMGDFRMDLKYRDFTPEMLETLISQSKSCSQEIEYTCRRAPLDLSTRTWFTSPSNKFITNFGTRTPSVCRCNELGSCDNPKVPCNCDLNDGILRTDKGIISNPDHMPLTSMVFLQGNDQREDSEAQFTLKPLVCITEASKEQTISFTEVTSYLEVPAWREGSLFLTFRTTSKKAIIAYQPAYHPSHATFMIALVGARELEFSYRYQGEVHQQVLYTTKPLNDGQWQQVLVDVYNQQLRFVVNNEETMIEVDPEVYLGVLDGSMFLGGIPEQFQAEEEEDLALYGLIGCIRGLTLNEEVVNLKRFYRSTAQGVSIGCTPSCEPDPCQNGAQCVEMWGTYKCLCANPLAHSGKNCENNINKDAIAFMTEDSKYKYFTNDSTLVGEKILHETFLINFRTHSDSGLLVFAYNYLHNFVQLYLAAENEVAFLFNHGSEVKKIVVTASDGVVFNKGQSVQVKVERSNTFTSLIIFTEGSTFQETLEEVGLKLLQEEDYEQFPFGESQPLPEMVYYPHSMTKPNPFFLAYLGSATDIQHDIKTNIPGITGCIRGLKIGDESISLTNILSKSPYPTSDVVANCKMACDMQPCLHGGKCTEDFQFYNNFHCDCAETSYTGATCNDETAYTFYGDQWITLTSSTSPLESDFKFELAFSTSTRYSDRQAVALLRSTNPSSLHDYLLIWIDSDGSIVVESELHEFDEDMVHGARVSPSPDNIDAFDGLRHYIIVERKDGDWTVKIDGEERQQSGLRNVYISETEVKATPTSLYMGGIEAGLDDRFTHYHSFRGCISNVHLKTPAGDSYPLRQYSEGDLHLKNRGIPGQGRCAPFAHFGGTHHVLMSRAYSVNASAVMGTEWVYKRPVKMPYETMQALRGHPERDTPFDNVVPAVAGTIFAIALLVVVGLLLKSYLSKKKKEEKKKKLEEQKPLYNGKKAGSSYGPKRTNTFTITQNQEMVPLKSAPDGIPQTTSDETRVTIPEEPVKFSEVLLTKEGPADRAPVEEATQDVPEVPLAEKESLEAATDGTEEVQVHTDAAGESEEVQERAVVEPKSGDDSSSESSIDCTIDINSSPPPSPAASPKTAPDSVEEATVTPSNAEQIDKDAEEGSDPEPVLEKYVPLPEGSDEPASVESKPEDEGKTQIDFSQVPIIKIDRSQSEDAEVIVDDEPEADGTDAKPMGGEEEKKEQSKEDGVIVADKPEVDGTNANQMGGEPDLRNGKSEAREGEKPEEPQETPVNNEEDRQKAGDTDEEFFEVREENVQIQNAQRMSKPI